MPNQWDLTGENIENTYQRVLQTPDGVNIYDGTGSLFTLPSAGVSQITAGNGISISPVGGTGVVEITSLAGSYNTATGSYGSFYDTGSQTAVSTTTIYSMSLSTTDISNGVYISGSDRTRIYVTNAGVYNFQFSAQFSNTSNNDPQDVAVWLRKNDNSSANDIVDSNSFVTVPGAKGGNPGQIIAAWNFFLELAANDFVQLLWHAEKANVITLETIAAGTNPTHPRTPSLIATVQRVDTFLSNTGSFSGSFIGTHTGSFTGSFTGSLLGTASWADSASQALTASFYQETDPIFTAKSASLATTGSNIFVGNQVVSGSFIIDTASSDAALRVTQTGTGNAILVEDSTNPDSTPFVVTATGNVGIGLTNPSAPLHTKGQFFLGTGGANANQGAFNWFTANNTYTFRNSPNGDRGLQIGVNVLLDGAGGTAGAVISPVAATGGAGLVLNGSTLGTSNTTLSSSKDLVITSTGNIGLGINTPSYKLDVSGSARVTSSLFLPGLTTTAQNNVVTVDITTGQLYYTASTAFGGGSSTPTFPYTGSAIISGSLVVTGSISSLNTTASQETFSSATYISGDIIQGTVVGVSQYDLAYLNINGTWQHVDQTSDTSTKMLGIYLGGDQILIDGNISATTAGVGSPIGVDIMNPDQGLPVYIDSGSAYDFNTTIPTSDYIRTLGYVYYNNTMNTDNWILKFRPSTDWYKI